jgi:hypothetical protein
VKSSSKTKKDGPWVAMYIQRLNMKHPPLTVSPTNKGSVGCMAHIARRILILVSHYAPTLTRLLGL